MNRYYLTQRPPAPGTFPGKPVNMKAFDSREHVEEIGRPAWGWVEYEEPLTEKQIADYELVKAAKRTISIELNTRELKFLAEFAEKQHDGDLPVFRELLMKIGKQLLQEGEGHE